MAARCRILWRNLADEASLSAPAAASGFPAVMLQDFDPAKICKSVAGDLVIQGSWPRPQTCSALALLRHNLTAGASITLTTDSGQQVTGKPWLPVYPFGRGPFGRGPIGGYLAASERREMMPMPFCIIYFSAPLRFSSWTLNLHDPNNPDGHVEAGRLFLGPHLESTINHRWPYGFGFTDQSQMVKLPTGAKRFQPGERLARLELEFSNMEAAPSFSDFLRFLYVVGQSVPFIIDVEPEGPSSRRFWLRRYVRCLTENLPQLGMLHRGQFKLSLEEAR